MPDRNNERPNYYSRSPYDPQFVRHSTMLCSAGDTRFSWCGRCHGQPCQRISASRLDFTAQDSVVHVCGHDALCVRHHNIRKSSRAMSNRSRESEVVRACAAYVSSHFIGVLHSLCGRVLLRVYRIENLVATFIGPLARPTSRLQKIFLRSVLRSGEILLQNCATLRNALRKRNYELPGVSNAMQTSGMLRNSLGLNYKSASLPAELKK